MEAQRSGARSAIYGLFSQVCEYMVKPWWYRPEELVRLRQTTSNTRCCVLSGRVIVKIDLSQKQRPSKVPKSSQVQANQVSQFRTRPQHPIATVGALVGQAPYFPSSQAGQAGKAGEAWVTAPITWNLFSFFPSFSSLPLNQPRAPWKVRRSQSLALLPEQV